MVAAVADLKKLWLMLALKKCGVQLFSSNFLKEIPTIHAKIARYFRAHARHTLEQSGSFCKQGGGVPCL